MAQPNKVKTWYSLFQARWYNPFRFLWTKIVSEKAENIFTQLLRKEINPDTNILDLGCGTGINVDRIKDLKFKSYTGLDLTPAMLDQAKEKYSNLKNVSFMIQDISKRPIDKKYDLIISTWVLSLLDRPAETINQYYQQLNPQGKMLLVFLTRPAWYVHFWFYPFIRLFASQYVTEKEINKIKGKKTVRRYFMTTLMEVEK
tara:strand:- start:605 stop:1207 length:603 start_codon:yes stop_codon:yes gene_type:complete